jgi:hypothetical protein
VRTTTGAMGASGGAGNVVTGRLLLTNSPLGRGRAAKRVAKKKKNKTKNQQVVTATGPNQTHQQQQQQQQQKLPGCSNCQFKHIGCIGCQGYAIDTSYRTGMNFGP